MTAHHKRSTFRKTWEALHMNCTTCHRPIPKERLLAVPGTSQCIRCKELAEADVPRKEVSENALAIGSELTQGEILDILS